MREAFIEKKFSADTLAIIEQANGIIETYQAQGFTLTLRQLYYQFVARDLLPNTVQSYKRLGGIISDGRLAGEIDWEAIEDRTRTVETINSWGEPQDLLNASARQYKIDLWEGQEYQPEVWIEKEALVGVIEPICRELRLPYFACRGYASQSAQYEASKRFKGYIDAGSIPVILHLGDHDPSGIDMTRENQTKISLLTGQDIEVRRLALNMDQVRRYRPPPNPAKDTDARFAGYVTKFGTKSWELDALEPTVIAALIREATASLRNDDTYAEREERERDERALLAAAAERWDELTEFLKEND